MDVLKLLLLCLYDPDFETRVQAVQIVGRLTVKNPAYVLPALRRLLRYLLTSLGFSDNKKTEQENIQLLGILIVVSPRLVRPYVDAIMKCLLLKVRGFAMWETSRNLHVSSALFVFVCAFLSMFVFTCMFSYCDFQTDLASKLSNFLSRNGCRRKSRQGTISPHACSSYMSPTHTLAHPPTLLLTCQVAGEDMAPYVEELYPVLLESLKDQLSVSRREMGLNCLGCLAEATGVCVCVCVCVCSCVFMFLFICACVCSFVHVCVFS